MAEVVDGADLDLVELALALGAPVVGRGELADREGTVVARIAADGLTPVRPLAPRPELRVPGVVALDDPAVLAAPDAVVFDALPSRSQIAAVDGIGTGAVAWFALTGRGRPGVPAGRLLRAVQAAAAAWSARTGRPAPVAALPWSLDAAPTRLTAPTLGDADGLAALLGDALRFGEVVVLGEGEEHRALARLEADAAAAARALFPAEVRPHHRADPLAGAVVLLTGLSGSGKSTIAAALRARLADARPISLLDGDDVRRLLSSGLGFGTEDRATNVRRIGWVAVEVARAGGVAIAAPIAPSAAVRHEVRAAAAAAGVPFVLVHVATPLAVCEARDRKGLYALARAGGIAEFTGVSAPYEPPLDAEVVVDTAAQSVDACVDAVLGALEEAA